LSGGVAASAAAGVTLIPQAKTLSHQVAVPTFVISNKESMAGSLTSSQQAELLPMNAKASGEFGGAKLLVENRSVSISLKQLQLQQSSSNGSTFGVSAKAPFQSTVKGGLILLFDPTVSAVSNGTDQELCMEMKRASLAKYRNAVLESWKRQVETM
jgi:hypothetical protein